jgi:hypothetical protein
MTFSEFMATNFHQFWVLTGFANCTWQLVACHQEKF